MKAIDSYDRYTHSRFSSYASSWMKQNIDRYISNHERFIRIPIHLLDQVKKAKKIVESEGIYDDEVIVELLQKKLSLNHAEAEEITKYLKSEDIISIEEVLENGGEITTYDSQFDNNLDDIVESEELSVILKKLFSTLLPRDQLILKLRYGLEDGQLRTLEEVGQQLSLTRERVRQIESKAIRRFKHPAKLKYLSDYYDRNYNKERKSSKKNQK